VAVVGYEQSSLRLQQEEENKDFLSSPRSLKRQARPSALLPTLQDERRPAKPRRRRQRPGQSRSISLLLVFMLP
jgi:hypothetical protein